MKINAPGVNRGNICQNGLDAYLQSILLKSFQGHGPYSFSCVVVVNEIENFSTLLKSRERIIGVEHTKTYNLVIFLDDISRVCLLYTSDAADDLLCVDLGGRRIIIKKKQKQIQQKIDKT